MLAVPPLLDVLGLRPGVKVGLAVQNGRLVVEPSNGLATRSTSCSPNATRRPREPIKSANGSMTACGWRSKMLIASANEKPRAWLDRSGLDDRGSGAGGSASVSFRSKQV